MPPPGASPFPRPAPLPGPAAHRPPKVAADTKPAEPVPTPGDPNAGRSAVAKAAVAVAFGGGIVKGIVFDRGRVLLAAPRSMGDNVSRARWAAQLVSGKLHGDVVPTQGHMMTPHIKLRVPVSGRQIDIASKVAIPNGWKWAYRISNGVGVGLAATYLLYGIPNLVDGLQSGQGLLETRAGRTGLLGTTSNVLELGLLGYALLHAPSGSVRGLSRLSNALGHDLYKSHALFGARLAFSLPLLANEAGYLDFLNKDDGRSPLQTATDTTVHQLDEATHLPVIGGLAHLLGGHDDRVDAASSHGAAAGAA